MGVRGICYTDHLGTPQAMTDAAQAIVWNAKVEPFGKVLIKNQTIVNNVRLPGQYFDAETGLHQNRFRDYDPNGRYIQFDPIGLAGGINGYGYAKQNPLKYVDPDGKNPLILGGALLVGGAIIVGGGLQSLQHAKDPSGGKFDPPLPKPLDPYTETNTTEKTAPNFPTKDPSDCDKQYDDDVDACKDTCNPLSVSRYWCIAKALAKYRACRRINNPAGSDWTE